METSLSPPRPCDVDDGGADQKHDEEEELESSGFVDDALGDGSTDRINIDDGGADRKCDEEEDLQSGGGEKNGCRGPRRDPTTSWSRRATVAMQS
jgi:hypothetical protein